MTSLLHAAWSCQDGQQCCSDMWRCFAQGLGLGKDALDILRSFGLSGQVEDVSLPLPTDINRAVRPDGAVRVLSRDDSYGHRRRVLLANSTLLFLVRRCPACMHA